LPPLRLRIVHHPAASVQQLYSPHSLNPSWNGGTPAAKLLLSVASPVQRQKKSVSNQGPRMNLCRLPCPLAVNAERTHCFSVLYDILRFTGSRQLFRTRRVVQDMTPLWRNIHRSHDLLAYKYIIAPLDLLVASWLFLRLRAFR